MFRISNPLFRASLTLCVILFAPQSAAQYCAGNEYQIADDAPRLFSSQTGEKALSIQEAMNAENYAYAVETLNSLSTESELSPYERGAIMQMLGAAQYEQNLFDKAIASFKAALCSKGLTSAEIANLNINIAQLMIANGDYAGGVKRLEAMHASGISLSIKQMEILMQAWIQAGEFAKALPWAETWFQTANPKEREHFDLLNFLYGNLGMLRKQADIVKEMIHRWPEDQQLWDSWAVLLANGGREDEAFEVRKMQYLGGFTTEEADLLRLVQHYAYRDMPYQAAQILEREMQLGRISETPARLNQLSELLRQARDYSRAIPVIEKAARSGKPYAFAELGEALFNQGDCASAETAFLRAINGGYSKPAKLWMFIGTCRYEQSRALDAPGCNMTGGIAVPASDKHRKRNSAVEAFDSVTIMDAASAQARQWIKFINAEAKAEIDRCEFNRKRHREACFLQIQNAFRNRIFELGQLRVDEVCTPFIPEYRVIYLQSEAQADD